MAKKKKKDSAITSNLQVTEHGRAYYNLWYRLNHTEDEKEMIEVKLKMNSLWDKMDSKDKGCFYVMSKDD